jgi:oligoendopeptidase F
LIALKLLQVFNENPDRFSLLFDNVLCAGGSRSTADVLMSLGVDIYSSRLSRDGVAVLSQLMKGGL